MKQKNTVRSGRYLTCHNAFLMDHHGFLWDSGKQGFGGVPSPVARHLSAAIDANIFFEKICDEMNAYCVRENSRQIEIRFKSCNCHERH